MSFPSAQGDLTALPVHPTLTQEAQEGARVHVVVVH